ncbi:hypothetical protein PLICRDRAFT_180651 [Plicaturopsis crispa FD-325 SS-3]|uniref:Uncharacterized protein n=1 Tax=Plicaturopsis crispa FD-325 SS-3 TaxID=944288 RepID=A0A0C9SVN4_PLICR|nr:hypothetical protein PLICRDRAFT_180651 [Plicaturopsis crispa FD-325 SS-3]
MALLFNPGLGGLTYDSWLVVLSSIPLSDFKTHIALSSMSKDMMDEVYSDRFWMLLGRHFGLGMPARLSEFPGKLAFPNGFGKHKRRQFVVFVLHHAFGKEGENKNRAWHARLLRDTAEKYDLGKNNLTNSDILEGDKVTLEDLRPQMTAMNFHASDYGILPTKGPQNCYLQDGEERVWQAASYACSLITVPGCKSVWIDLAPNVYCLVENNEGVTVWDMVVKVWEAIMRPLHVEEALTIVRDIGEYTEDEDKWSAEFNPSLGSFGSFDAVCVALNVLETHTSFYKMLSCKGFGLNAWETDLPNPVVGDCQLYLQARWEENIE